MTPPGHPFFRSYGANLPSSLRGVHSRAFGLFDPPTCVGLRYGRPGEGPRSFSRRPRPGDPPGPVGPGVRPPFDRGSGCPFRSAAPQRWARPSAVVNPRRCGNFDPLVHRRDPSAPRLGPDSPWADEPCPGTLGFTAAGTLTRLVATHVCILTWAGSTGGPPPASPLGPTFPYRA